MEIRREELSIICRDTVPLNGSSGHTVIGKSKSKVAECSEISGNW